MFNGSGGGTINSGLFEKLREDQSGFCLISDRLKALTGINLPLNEKNLALVASRLLNLVAATPEQNYKSLDMQLSKSVSGLKEQFVSALTTNTTQFFREPNHFDVLTTRINDIVDQKIKTREALRVWCSASSTGQEPVSILITILENQKFQNSGLDLKFLSTDIDLKVLQYAANGLYTETEIASLPLNYKVKYFVESQTKRGLAYQLKPEYLKKIRYSQFNLLTPEYPFEYKFDFIFCRNVLIYFEPIQAIEVVMKMTDSLSNTGSLFLGYSEPACGRIPALVSNDHSVFEKSSVGMSHRKAA